MKTTVDDIRDNDHTKPLKESVIASAYWGYLPMGFVHSGEKPYSKLFLGKRHCHCITEMKEAGYVPQPTREPLHKQEYNEGGFLTSKNRYVDRFEAMNIAIEFGQLLDSEKCQRDTRLFSEDLR